MVATVEAVSSHLASTSASTRPSRWNSSSLRNRSRRDSLHILYKAAGISAVRAQAPGFREIEHLPHRLEDPVRLIGLVPAPVMQRRDVLAFDFVDGKFT